MGTIKAKLCKQIMKETYMGQLEWARSQTTKITQIRDIKSSSIKQTRRLRRNGGLYFKSGKNACISFKLWDIGQRVLQTPQETSLMRSIKWKATLKWPSLKSLLENFHLWEILNRGGRPRELGRNKKNKKKICVFFHRLSRPSEVMCFLTLPLFERAFEPSLPFERAFEPSPLFRARLWALASFRARLWALDHPRVNHYKETFFFFLGRSPITIRSLLKKKR